MGDEINVLMAAAAWNLKKWLATFFVLCFFWFHYSKSTEQLQLAMK